jgi:hypothetical protein
MSFGLVMDHAGNLYGTTRNGGSFDNGPFCQVYSEIGCGTVTIGPNGTVYGSTESVPAVPSRRTAVVSYLISYHRQEILRRSSTPG